MEAKRPGKRSGETRPKEIKIAEAERLLRGAGFQFVEDRKGKHNMWIHKDTGEKFPLTRGSGQSLSVHVTRQVFGMVDKYTK